MLLLLVLRMLEVLVVLKVLAVLVEGIFESELYFLMTCHGPLSPGLRVLWDIWLLARVQHSTWTKVG